MAYSILVGHGDIMVRQAAKLMILILEIWLRLIVSTGPFSLVIAMLSFLYLHLLHLMQMRDKTTAIQIYLGQKPEIGRSVSTPLAASSSSAAATEESFLATMRAEGSVQGVRGGNLGM